MTKRKNPRFTDPEGIKRAAGKIPKNSEKRGPGQPPYEPDQVVRDMVKALAMGGMSQERMAAAIGVSVETLVRAFAVELREAKPHILAKATGRIYNSLDSQKEEVALSAAKYVLSTQFKHLGWSMSLDLTVKRDVWKDADPARLTDEEFRQFICLAQKMGVVFEEVHMPVGVSLPLLLPPSGSA